VHSRALALRDLDGPAEVVLRGVIAVRDDQPLRQHCGRSGGLDVNYDGPVSPRLRSRWAQVDLLRGQLNALGAGRGSVVLVTGPAGVGKTTLLAEAASLAADGGALVFRGGGDPAARAVPLGVILDAFVSTDEPPVDPARLRELSQSPDQRFWLVRELQESLEKAAHRAALLVIVDDLQWVDAASASTLVTLSRRLATHRISWLLALRRGQLADAALDAVGRLEAAGASEVRLGPLDKAAVEQVALEILGGEPDEALREVLSRAEGQPFLLTELLRGLRTEDLVTVDGGTARLAAGARLPHRLVDSVAAQLGRLTVPARDTVEMASVLGHSFSLDELGGLLGRPPLDLRSEVREAMAAALLTEDGERLGFRHDLVREAVDASLPKAVRRSMRRTAVEVMLRHGASAADVAQLVMDAAEPGDVASADLLRRAAAQIGRVSPAVAAPLSLRALDLMPRGGPGRGEAVVQAIDLLVQAGRAAEAAKLLTASESDLADPVAEARARLGIGMLMVQYAPAAVAEQCQAALRLPDVPPSLRVQLLSLLACGLDISGKADAASGPVAEAIAEAAASGDPAAEIVTFVPRALLAFAQGDWRGAIDLAGEAARRRPEARGLRRWLPETWRSLLLISELRLAEAHAIIEVGTREDENVPRNIRVWSMLRCRARLAAGQLADARAEAEAILDMSDEIGDGSSGYLNRLASYVLGDIALRTGAPAALRSARRDAAALYGADSGCAATKRLGAWLTVRLDGGPIGPDLLDVLAPGYVHACSPVGHSDAVELVRLLLTAGQRLDAASVTALLENGADANPGFPGLRSAALHARALLDRDPEQALAAVQAYRGDPRSLVRAAAFEDAGRLLKDRAKEEAVGHLDEALRLQAAAGAERDAARVRRLLRDCGVQRAGGRPDPAAASWQELTASEIAVVQLVIQGATDRDVAQRLYISAHTVNSHLRHVFAKLDIRSRVELARQAGQREAAELPSCTPSLRGECQSRRPPPCRASLISAIPAAARPEAINHLIKSCAACQRRSRLGSMP
jgi:DNA-binding NarL/FixJ family response regulator